MQEEIAMQKDNLGFKEYLLNTARIPQKDVGRFFYWVEQFQQSGESKTLERPNALEAFRSKLSRDHTD